jgi:hypothetical protein
VARIVPEYQKAAPSSHTQSKPIVPKAAARSSGIISVPLPQKPPLEGSQSLKEALAQALGKKEESKPSGNTQSKPVHAVDLKATLHAVAPKAEAAPKLPEDELRSMLAVDESLDNEQS